MATTTPNFGWSVPTSTDLVKDGATAIETLGDSIDASLVDLKGGTTGQVLAKASNTDMDFSWVAQDDSNAIQNAIVDAKGDLIGATAADTPARLAVGTNGQVLTADSTAATGLAWVTASAGGMTSIASGSLTGASVTLSSISGSYNNLVLVLRDYYASSNFGIQITVNAVADYTFVQFATQTTSSSGSQTYSEVGSTVFTTHYSNMLNSDNNNFASIEFFDYANAVSRKCIQSNSGYLTSTSVKQSTLNFGHANMSAAISSITIATSGGTFSGGTYVLYGVK
jgi:hypothetical protein